VRDELVRVSAEFDRMVQAIAHNERQIRSIVDTAYDAFVSTDRDGQVVAWSRQAEALFGWSRQEVLGEELGALIVPERYRALHRAGLAAVAYGAEGRILGRPLELPAVCRDGREVPVELVVWATQVDGELRFHSFLRDISERKRMEAELAHQAFHDALTGLPNRTLFQDRLEHALQRPGAGVGVIFCDLDDFKTVNDSMGHAAGDRLLLEVARRLQDAVRAGDTLARLAGDEFAVLVEDATDEDVDAAAARILRALTPPVCLDGREVFAPASLGVDTMATLVPHVELSGVGPGTPADAGAHAQALLRNADAALYAAKRRGKHTVEWFAAEMHTQAVERLRLRADLHGALGRGEVRLEYQPYVDVHTGLIRGCEALVRWDHPARGPVLPAQFIPLAEETGFIRDLGRWVLREACGQLFAWQRDIAGAGDLTMGVNVSVRQLEDVAFVDDVAAILRETGVRPSAVMLEITESVLSDDQQVVLERLAELKELGVKIALDDFGTGYSSLARLRHIPVDVVKIDRSFVAPLGEGSVADSSVITAIVQIGAGRNLRTVAEGVETPEQLAALQDLGCDLVQGFFHHRPLHPSVLSRYLPSAAPGVRA
jgi:diguanylate cyclase (GGDEF)-like protein/PAS domain S-box-containing protein